MIDFNQIPDKQRGAENSAPLWLFAPARSMRCGRPGLAALSGSVRPLPHSVAFAPCMPTAPTHRR